MQDRAALDDDAEPEAGVCRRATESIELRVALMGNQGEFPRPNELHEENRLVAPGRNGDLILGPKLDGTPHDHVADRRADHGLELTQHFSVAGFADLLCHQVRARRRPFAHGATAVGRRCVAVSEANPEPSRCEWPRPLNRRVQPARDDVLPTRRPLATKHASAHCSGAYGPAISRSSRRLRPATPSGSQPALNGTRTLAGPGPDASFPFGRSRCGQIPSTGSTRSDSSPLTPPFATLQSSRLSWARLAARFRSPAASVAPDGGGRSASPTTPSIPTTAAGETVVGAASARRRGVSGCPSSSIAVADACGGRKRSHVNEEARVAEPAAADRAYVAHRNWRTRWRLLGAFRCDSQRVLAGPDRDCWIRGIQQCGARP